MEVLGAVGSGIALGEVAKVVIRIKRMWNEVEGVPDRIRGLLDYLDFLGPLLEQIEHEFNNSPLPSQVRQHVSIQQSITLCQRAAQGLHGLAFQMEKEIGRTKALKKRLVCAKVALKKDVIAQLEGQLEMAINLFKISMTHYFMVTQNATNKAIQTLASNKPRRDIHMVFEDQDDDDLAEQLRGLAFIRKGCGSSHLKSKTYVPTMFGRVWTESAPDGSCNHWFFQPPSWLSMKIWEAELRNACSGWQKFGAIRCYNIRPASASVFKSISDGRTDDLLSQFQTREASPFDRDEDGRSLIYYAVLYNNLRLCRSLLTMGLDICLDEKYGKMGQESHLYRGDLTPRELTGQWNLPIYESSKNPEYQTLLREKIAIMDLFHGVEYYHYSASDTVQLLSQGLTDRRRWKADVLMHFQQRLAPSYYQLSFRSRLETVRRVVQGGWEETEADYPDLLRLLLKQDMAIGKDDVAVSIREGLSLIHTAAMGFAVSSSTGFAWKRKNVSASEERSAAWVRFASDVIRAASIDDLNTVETIQQLGDGSADFPDSWTGTPMLAMLHAASGSLEAGTSWRSHFQNCLFEWLTFLDINSVDLEEYGRHEEQIYRHLQMSISQRFRKRVDDWDSAWRGDPGSSELLLELRGFQYGADPADWELDWDVQTLQAEAAAAIVQAEQAEGPWSKDKAVYTKVYDDLKIAIPGSWVE